MSSQRLQGEAEPGQHPHLQALLDSGLHEPPFPRRPQLPARPQEWLAPVHPPHSVPKGAGSLVMSVIKIVLWGL